MDPRDLIKKNITKRTFLSSKIERKCARCGKWMNNFTMIQQYSPEAGKTVPKALCMECWENVLAEGPSRHRGMPDHEFR